MHASCMPGLFPAPTLRLNFSASTNYRCNAGALRFACLHAGNRYYALSYTYTTLSLLIFLSLFPGILRCNSAFPLSSTHHLLGRSIPPKAPPLPTLFPTDSPQIHSAIAGIADIFLRSPPTHPLRLQNHVSCARHATPRFRAHA